MIRDSPDPSDLVADAAAAHAEVILDRLPLTPRAKRRARPALRRYVALLLTAELAELTRRAAEPGEN